MFSVYITMPNLHPPYALPYRRQGSVRVLKLRVSTTPGEHLPPGANFKHFAEDTP